MTDTEIPTGPDGELPEALVIDLAAVTVALKFLSCFPPDALDFIADEVGIPSDSIDALKDVSEKVRLAFENDVRVLIGATQSDVFAAQV